MLSNLPRLLALIARHFGGYLELGAQALGEWTMELRRRLWLALLATAGVLSALMVVSVWVALTAYHTRFWPYLPLGALGAAALLALLCWGAARTQAPAAREHRSQFERELAADRDLLNAVREHYAP